VIILCAVGTLSSITAYRDMAEIAVALYSNRIFRTFGAQVKRPVRDPMAGLALLIAGEPNCDARRDQLLARDYEQSALY
jgi:hypothetical protein